MKMCLYLVYLCSFNSTLNMQITKTNINFEASSISVKKIEDTNDGGDDAD